MKITKEELDRVRSAITDDMLKFHNLIYLPAIEDYKLYIGDVSERMKTKDKWKANLSYPLIFMLVDTVFGTVFDFDYQLDIKNKKLERACVDAYDFKSYTKQAISMAGKEAIITGMGVMRDFTHLEKGTIETYEHEIDYEIKSPTSEYISIFNVMYDLSKGINDSGYKTIRQFLTIEDIKIKILSSIKDKEVFNTAIKKIEGLKDDENNKSFSMYNYEAIKGLLFSDQFIKSVINEDGKIDQKYSTSLNPVKNCDDLNFHLKNQMKSGIENSPFTNNFNTKFEVIEFVEGTKKHLFINGNHILTSKVNKNIYNIVGFEFNKIPGSGRSLGIARIVRDIALANNGFINMFIDSLSLANTMVFKKERGTPGSKNAKIEIKSGTVLDAGLSRINLGGGDFSGMNGMQAFQQIAQTALGINQMMIGGDSRIQRVAGETQFQFSQYKARLTPFLESVDLGMSKIVKGWIMQYLYLYSPDELKVLYDINISEIKTGKVVTDLLIDDILMKDILNENNISFKFDSMYNLKKDMEKKTAMEIFTLAEQYNNSKVDRVKFVKLLSGDKSVKLEDVLGIGNDSDLSEINIDDIDSILDESKDLDIPSEDNNLNIEETNSDIILEDDLLSEISNNLENNLL